MVLALLAMTLRGERGGDLSRADCTNLDRQSRQTLLREVIEFYKYSSGINVFAVTGRKCVVADLVEPRSEHELEIAALEFADSYLETEELLTRSLRAIARDLIA